MISLDDKEKLKVHANRNIVYLLEQLGVDPVDRGDGILQMTCPCLQHTGDRNNRTAWSWRRDMGRWICWTHHCEESRGNDVFGLISSIKGSTFQETIHWIRHTLKDKNVNVTDEPLKEEMINKGQKLHIHEPISENNLKFLSPCPTYLINRGYKPETMNKYQIGLWSRPGTYMHDRVVFPIRDQDNYLVGYTGRTIHQKSYFESRGLPYNKWVHGRHYNRWPQRGDLFISSVLYNLNNAQRYISNSKNIIIVEGPLDGLKLDQAGIHNWVATLGTSFSQSHRTLLIKAGFTDLYVAYDNDDPEKYKDGKNPADRAWKRIERVVGDLLTLHKIELPSGTDCGDLSEQELQNIFKEVSC